jgi:hypothetical protein
MRTSPADSGSTGSSLGLSHNAHGPRLRRSLYGSPGEANGWSPP